jgi:HK97 family phage major capsid protein
MMARGAEVEAAAIFEGRWPRSKHLDAIRKATVPAGTTGGWGAPLSPLQPLAAEFVELVRPSTVIGRMRGFRRVPFRVRFPRQTSGALVGWVGEYRPAPVGKIDLEGETFEHSKVGGIVVISNELARSSDPAAEALIQRDLIAAVAQFTDEQFLNPAVAEVADVSPASITHNAVGIPSTGSGAAQIEADLKALVATLQDAGIQFLAPYFIMKPSTALHLAGLKGANGERVFPGVNVLGGEIWGVPVIVSASAGNQITLVDAAEILLAEGAIELDASEEATLQMDSDPVTGAANMVSLYQNNLMGLMATRLIRWELRRPGAAAYVSGVTY